MVTMPRSDPPTLSFDAVPFEAIANTASLLLTIFCTTSGGVLG